MIETRPTWRRKTDEPESLEYNDASNSTRLQLLMDWWQITNDNRFADSIMKIARNSPDLFSAALDGVVLIEFISKIRAGVDGKRFVYEVG
ncbi:MAG: hypothetical protein LRY75_21695 [Shewanella xiamenensis]|jgi:hypothetical protein|uniref:hypothetical protein n=1 Tax=Shewanella TaxID=22 RepID=UPI001C4E6E80|nr:MULTISPECIES: hypothetical protein [Shewanella]MBW0281208.1 hypothetical protein [Shewanella xiamenensis]MCD8551938.1 hypothetical protein [Shewanella xiamenensis]MCD8561361.1 hypothetical protein [Shewanella xiamenensis]MCU8107443.1 hypothetical protein [Shewanella sp. SM101]